MSEDKRLIILLEAEARALRNRLEGLSERRIPAGATTGEADPGPAQARAADIRARLAEIDEHLRELGRA